MYDLNLIQSKLSNCLIAINFQCNLFKDYGNTKLCYIYINDKIHFQPYHSNLQILSPHKCH